MDAVVYVRESALAESRWAVSAYRTALYDDGAVVDNPEWSTVPPLVWKTVASDRGLLRIEVGPDEIPDAPNVWFVHVDEPKASPRATNLVAFATDHFPAGTVVTKYQFASLSVSNDDQVGAIRWYPTIATVHQVYVAQGWRRRKAGSALIYAADAVHQSLGWPGRLHSDGRRTDLGEQFMAAQRYPARFAARTETTPSMDGPEPLG